jgi:predicted transcriptional regulator
MDRHAYHVFQILEHVEKTPVLTNRKAARKLEVSVKLAHSLLSQLVTKGLLHIHKQNSRRWDYFLTPTGIAEKARLTYQFLDFTMQFYREARRRSAEVLAAMEKSGVRRIAFLGATELAEIAYLGIRERNLVLTDVFDDTLAGKDFLGIPVQAIHEMANCKAERILVTAFDPKMPMGERYLPQPAAALLETGVLSEDQLAWVFTSRNDKPIVPRPERSDIE